MGKCNCRQGEKVIDAGHGAEALPREIAETRIPLIVDLLEPPDTTLFHALFATDPENVAV
ncbi:hypothetical protein F0U60_15415 [Archangium minus]|uniref:Uncharacterized protein n=1 Tax=Archangium minus TaxID=83450 RepID=A0ABY9WNW9_9BACT|nr:hypothetical protein F0U60_15415 [Archangium minus]